MENRFPMCILGIKGAQQTREILAESTQGCSERGRIQRQTGLQPVSLWQVCLRSYVVQLCAWEGQSMRIRGSQVVDCGGQLSSGAHPGASPSDNSTSNFP